ncbi:hypothetical protein DVB69_10480 [Sporosarcina sp. BI001-red]|uniref:STM3941 family protein n=1 Tax=Sporosarcina sp. BI001-red TaxID=2282866 RepID=UPI000E2556B4|nr:STM3941 family protein [Sporosarcina sp. BI001-red]REB07265.1 hypothetical protein DVB69_10480 [Sporosarcina sp. BI001-red]
MEELVVFPKRGRMLGFGIVCILTSAFGLFLTLLLIVGEAPIYIGLIGIGLFLVCGFSSIFYIKRVIIHQPALIVSNEGITDNSSYIGAGLVNWDDIANIGMIEESGQPFLAIYTFDPDLIINRTDTTKRMANKANKYLLASQVNIPVNNLAIPLNELLEKIAVVWERQAEKSV